MKNANFMGVQWKIQFLERVLHKTIHKGDYWLKRGFGQFADLRALAKKRGWCFWKEVDTPMRTMLQSYKIRKPNEEPRGRYW